MEFFPKDYDAEAERLKKEIVELKTKRQNEEKIAELKKQKREELAKIDELKGKSIKPIDAQLNDSSKKFNNSWFGQFLENAGSVDLLGNTKKKEEKKDG